MVVKRAFLKWYPKVFILTAHIGGCAICIWMGRMDLLIAGIAFGITSSMLFYDLMPGGKGWTISLMRKLIHL
ncbi:MAG: hypothetical protein U9R75_11430 [Candidatus Thermoplasmatota archaeon]|nr:hypothetical protein [Candidatus Thermoplasmatota archaeon]